MPNQGKYTWIILGLLLLFSPLSRGQSSVSSTQIQILSHAELISLQGHRPVDLPHILNQDDFVFAGGSRVRYWVDFYLPGQPDEPLGVFVSKMSLSGQLWINGHLAGQCALGKLENLRCKNQPQLFVVYPHFWKVGHNRLEFEIFANISHISGLSAIEIGPVEVLNTHRYQPLFWWRVDLMSALVWLSLILGSLSFIVGVVSQRDVVFFWFGLTSMTNALSINNSLVSQFWLPFKWIDWILFSSRFVSTSLFLLMLLAIFDKLSQRIKHVVLAYTGISVILYAFSGSSKTTLIGLYFPLILTLVSLMFAMTYWSWRTRKNHHRLITFAVCVAVCFGVWDWIRLSGLIYFEGIYLFKYAYSGVLVLMGGLLMQRLVVSLIRARELSESLELKVVKRTQQLEQAHQHLLQAQIDQSRAKERERIVRDMHDGFGSQLVFARIMIENSDLDSAQLAALIDDCIADLYLVIDSLAEDETSLMCALGSFRYRTEQRLMGSGITLHWRLNLDEKTDSIPHSSLLQVLRILQESVNNVLKHAQAQHIYFEFEYQPESHQVVIRVMDDGIGFLQKSGSPSEGWGLKNMKQRAVEIGADLSITPHQPEFGTVMELKLPFNELKSDASEV